MHISTACITKVTKGLVSPDGSDVGRGKHLIQCFHHVTHSHQSCGGRVSSWVLTDLRCPPTDVQTSASITRQSGHLPDMVGRWVHNRAGETALKTIWLPTFLDTNCRASSSKAFNLFSLDMMISCNCLKLYGWNDILVKPWTQQCKWSVAFSLCFFLTSHLNEIFSCCINIQIFKGLKSKISRRRNDLEKTGSKVMSNCLTQSWMRITQVHFCCYYFVTASACVHVRAGT